MESQNKPLKEPLKELPQVGATVKYKVPYFTGSYLYFEGVVLSLFGAYAEIEMKSGTITHVHLSMMYN